eukprot:TRINITY_DN703_c0_g2_i1.p1 TRINITY_DN703_c0_g2~~TRINITY_DN703_c0_g2_i1.p1  ORF type:complete len:129 (-),score=27.66 TRINITY_DN703_c0_g2_i1:425-811(-)
MLPVSSGSRRGMCHAARTQLKRTPSGFDKDFDRVIGYKQHAPKKPEVAAGQPRQNQATGARRSLVFKRTESGFDRDFDRIVCSGMAKTVALVNTPNQSCYDATWGRIIARHEALQGDKRDQGARQTAA